MSLARVKTWVAAEVLFASDLNAEFNNVLNNAMSLISPLTGALDVNGNDLTAIDELALSDASGNASAAGRLRRNSTNITWHDGTAARRLAAMDTSNNFGLGTYSFGSSAASVMAFPNATAPSTSPADLVQVYAGDQAAGKSSLIIRTEDGSIHHLGSNVGIGQASFGTDADNVLAIGAGTTPTTFPADAVQALVKDAGVGGTAAFWLYDEIGGNMRLGSTTTTDNGFSITSQSGVSFLARTGSGEIVLQSTSGLAVRGTASALRTFFDDSGNVGIKTSSFGTSAAGVFAIASSTAPTTAVADSIQMWQADIGGAGTSGPRIMVESTEVLDVGGVIERGNGNPYKDVVSTTDETSIFSSAPTIKGNTLGTSRGLHVTLIGDLLANNGTPTFTVRIKYGATTVAAFTTNALSASATRRGWRGTGTIAAAGATNAQVASFHWLAPTATGVSGTAAELETAGNSSIMLSTHNAVAIDSTADATLDITLQNSASHASVSCRVFAVLVELV